MGCKQKQMSNSFPVDLGSLLCWSDSLPDEMGSAKHSRNWNIFAVAIDFVVMNMDIIGIVQ